MSATDGELLMGRYRLYERLGQGGFGTVYRADQMTFGQPLREVAIKISNRPLSPSEARATFADALLLARLSDECGDPTIKSRLVTIYDAGHCGDGEFQGRAYCVMEIARGGSLRRRLTGRPLPLKQTLHYMSQVLETVAYMHQGSTDRHGQRRPVVHRDLKPSNVLIATAGADSSRGEQLKVSDFGLAVDVGPMLGWAEAGGTLAYMAPESFSEQRCSPATDVYSLGLMFYEMLTGVQPFAEVAAHVRGSTGERAPEVREAHMRARDRETFGLLDQAAELRDEPALRAVIHRCLEAEEAERYQDARDLLADLRRATGEDRGGPLLPREVSPREEILGLVERARRLLQLGERDAARQLADQAMATNREPTLVSDEQVVGAAYELTVRLMLEDGEVDEARRVANEGYQRRRCRGTCQAMAMCLERMGAGAARAFRAEAQRHPPES